MSTNHERVALIANEAVDALQVSREHTRWLSALGKAIHTDLTAGQGFIAKDLASLVQYLADDHSNVLDSQARDFEAGLLQHDLRA
ncbi:hypothetical protein [Pseudomonas turukhanskensis]|uniref:Uncharacterized protein n=1 Tax=Pseudomonas turukhanskensis TaxID=1806536 RepID=A0A9W6NGP8_9PSED|nr:hypothetical protein [Pseudomonas turukhanskensis]GLK90040.1 hypothetical protein GCM10017655_31020 [Pseudomonas turukhanskensis]